MARRPNRDDYISPDFDWKFVPVYKDESASNQRNLSSPRYGRGVYMSNRVTEDEAKRRRGPEWDTVGADKYSRILWNIGLGKKVNSDAKVGDQVYNDKDLFAAIQRVQSSFFAVPVTIGQQRLQRYWASVPLPQEQIGVNLELKYHFNTQQYPYLANWFIQIDIPMKGPQPREFKIMYNGEFKGGTV